MLKVTSPTDSPARSRARLDKEADEAGEEVLAPGTDAEGPGSVPGAGRVEEEAASVRQLPIIEPGETQAESSVQAGAQHVVETAQGQVTRDRLLATAQLAHDSVEVSASSLLVIRLVFFLALIE